MRAGSFVIDGDFTSNDATNSAIIEEDADDNAVDQENDQSISGVDDNNNARNVD